MTAVPAGEPIDAPYLTVLYNDGVGNFPTRREYADPQIITGYAMAVGDFDGDARPDLALDDGATRSALVLLNRGDGQFERPVLYGAMGESAEWIADLLAVDLLHSGRPDLLALQAGNYVSVLPNLGCRRCFANCDGSLTTPVLNATDFACFMSRFAARDPPANCDSSLTGWGSPALDVADFVCFMQRFAAGCP